MCRQVKGLSGELFSVQTGQWGYQVSCPGCRQVKELSGELSFVQTGQGAVM